MRGWEREGGCKMTFENVLIDIGKEARKETERQEERGLGSRKTTFKRYQERKEQAGPPGCTSRMKPLHKNIPPPIS